MSEFITLLPEKYFEVTLKPSFNSVFPSGTVMTMNPIENKKYEDWLKAKNVVHYDKPKPEFVNIVNTFINSTVKEKRDFLEKYDISEGNIYWHQVNRLPKTYTYIDKLCENMETCSLYETLKVKSVVSPDEKPRVKEVKESKVVKSKQVKEEKVVKEKKKRSLTEAQKKKVAARQDFKCANKNIGMKGLENYECPLWKYREGRFDESGYDIDHIIELAKEGSDTLDNCQALCICCHRVKTSRFLTNNKK
jgi:5-methylcytosine-specific restriction endonuclease McrA